MSGDDKARLLDSESSKSGEDSGYNWRRRRRKRSAAGQIFHPWARLVLLAWTILVVALVVVGSHRLSGVVKTKVSASDIFVNMANYAMRLKEGRMCYKPANLTSFCEDLGWEVVGKIHRIKHQVFVHDSPNQRCYPTDISAPCEGLAESRFFGSPSECDEHCHWGMAPVGAYLMIGAFVLALALIFSVFCIPLGRDKIMLKASLLQWLVVNFVCIAVVLAMSLVGAYLVIKHDEDSFVIEMEWKEKLLLDLALVISPFLSLGYPIYFWRSVLSIYQGLDTSKHVLSGVWSTKI